MSTSREKKHTFLEDRPTGSDRPSLESVFENRGEGLTLDAEFTRLSGELRDDQNHSSLTGNEREEESAQDQ